MYTSKISRDLNISAGTGGKLLLPLVSGRLSNVVLDPPQHHAPHCIIRPREGNCHPCRAAQWGRLDERGERTADCLLRGGTRSIFGFREGKSPWGFCYHGVWYITWRRAKGTSSADASGHKNSRTYYRGLPTCRTAARGPATLHRPFCATLPCSRSLDLETVRSPHSAITTLADASTQLRSSSSHPASISSTVPPSTPSVPTILTSSATLRRSSSRP